MSKLPEENKFFDLSDYGRPVAKMIANSLKHTRISPIHVTLWFVVAGIIALYFIYQKQYLIATFFLVLKSILDAADGELARIKKTPSYVGRYLDSVSDILLNLSLVLLIGMTNMDHPLVIFFAFTALQLQGTLYNYYYVILRSIHAGDTTSRIIENTAPVAFSSEKQSHVNVLFAMYKFCYGIFDYMIYELDPAAKDARNFPNWFMTVVSLYGLGFQLLMIGVLLVLGLKSILLPLVIGYSIGIPLLIAVRRRGL